MLYFANIIASNFDPWLIFVQGAERKARDEEKKKEKAAKPTSDQSKNTKPDYIMSLHNIVTIS